MALRKCTAVKVFLKTDHSSEMLRLYDIGMLVDRNLDRSQERKGEPIRNQAVAFKIRPMRTEEIPQVVELGRQSLFHYTSSALKFWHTKDPEGIIIAVTESG
ncbi:n-acetyltransferase domain-containing protein [Trichonephila clavipes]|nr:n-acetyltransferase domain-containing protein [Trichonephila clavipes]